MTEMPNNVKNIITCFGTDERIKKIKKLMHSDATTDDCESAFDFNNLIPENPDDSGWYLWRCEHWGTKWNAYRTEVEENTFRFETAWSSMGDKLLIKLSVLFPDVVFVHEWADEDFSFNLGIQTAASGKINFTHEFQHDTKDAYEFAAHVWDYDLAKDMNLYLNADGTNYEYREEE